MKKKKKKKEHDPALFPVTFGLPGLQTGAKEDKKAEEEPCAYGGERWKGGCSVLFPCFRLARNQEGGKLVM